jgi:hypothetical protein
MDGLTDRQIDMAKLIVAFGNFANEAKNEQMPNDALPLFFSKL